MSVREIEQAIRKLPEKKRRKLLLKLADDIEDIADICEMEKAVKEGGATSYEKFRKTLFKN